MAVWGSSAQTGRTPPLIQPFLMHELGDLWCFDFETTYREFESTSNDLYSSRVVLEL